MATVPTVAYLGDRYQYLKSNKWGYRPCYVSRTFQDGAIGQLAQNSISGLSDGWDTEAGGSTYSDEVLFEGRQVCKCTVNEGTRGNLYFGGAVDSGIGAYRYQSIWQQIVVMFPSSFDFDEVTDSMKFLRLAVTGPDGGVGSVNLNINTSAQSTMFNLIMEAHTSLTSGNTQHNSNNRFLPKSEWEFPRDQWVDIQMMSTFDKRYPENENSESEAVVRVWAGDTLLGEFLGTNADFHSMTSELDEMYTSRFCTYMNTDPSGVTKDMHCYVAEYNITNVPPTYTDVHGNNKLPSRI